MAHIISPSPQNAHGAAPKPITIPTDVWQPSPGPTQLPAPLPAHGMRSGHLNLQTFSPVNQNGSFAFDRVLKSGEVNKRTRKTKQWKSFYLVLRPNLLSIYKDPSESRLHKQVSLSDLTAVALLKDPKGRRENVFGLYSPARNFHLQARSQAEAQEWVELIKREARIDEQEEQEMLLNSPTTAAPEGYTGHDHWPEQAATTTTDRLGSSSPEPATTRDGIRIPGIRRPSAPSLDYSGDELNGPYMSDFSETQTPPPSYQPPSSFGSFIPRKQRQQNPPLHQHHETPYSQPQQTTNQRQLSTATRNLSQVSIGASHPDQDASSSSSEKVIWHGYLLLLRTKRAGVRQWKKLWVVLRPKNLAFYKSDEEYAAVLILPLSTCVDAVEIDPVSKSKRYCMQIITEEKGYRFCAENEDKLAEWLGALKMVMSRRRELEKEKEKKKEDAAR